MALLSTAFGAASTIPSNFSGTPIAAGNFPWFNSVLKVSGLGAHPVTICFGNSTIAFTANGTPFSLTVPPAQITFDPNATSASTTFDGVKWVTIVPSQLAGNTFLDGVAFPVPFNFPGGINPV